MSRFPKLYVARHGQTAWSVAGRHTGRTDLELLPEGEAQARALGVRLAGMGFAAVLTSPLQRARRTCEIAGFATAGVDPDLVEWDYGMYEGRRTDDIRAESPNWDVFRDGCPGGESVDAVVARADRVIARVRAVDGNALVFSSAHLSRVLAARWFGASVDAARHLMLAPASLSALSYEHDLTEPAILFWNDTSHLRE